MIAGICPVLLLVLSQTAQGDVLLKAAADYEAIQSLVVC